MGKIPFLVESPNGHDREEVPENQAGEAVKKHLQQDKLVMVEKEGGGTELLTKTDLPKDDPQSTSEFARKFEKIKSATVSNKIKGG
ncbi:hypothetical protein ES703_78176 [subsurface metagenome]